MRWGRGLACSGWSDGPRWSAGGLGIDRSIEVVVVVAHQGPAAFDLPVRRSVLHSVCGPCALGAMVAWPTCYPSRYPKP